MSSPCIALEAGVAEVSSSPCSPLEDGTADMSSFLAMDDAGDLFPMSILDSIDGVDGSNEGINGVTDASTSSTMDLDTTSMTGIGLAIFWVGVGDDTHAGGEYYEICS